MVPLAAIHHESMGVWIGVGLLGLVVLLTGAYRWNNAIQTGSANTISRFRYQTIASAAILAAVGIRLIAHIS